MKLIQNIDVYAPQHLGKKDVLTINDKIVNIAEAGSISADGILSDAEVIDGNDLIRLVIKYELYITPVTTYLLDGFYTED